MTVHALVERMLGGDRRALARLITLVESRSPEVPAIMAEVHRRPGHAAVLGITGPPGAGKSTLTDKLIGLLRARGNAVGVVAVDPSSPFTEGAVLGDRIRMQDHALDPGVFIRSLATRGVHGGLSKAARETIRLFSAFGMDYVVVETVGVGQTELDVMGVADTVVIVLVPESGDSIQAMKAGLMEIGDVFVVNKADRAGADRVVQELEIMIHLQTSPEDEWSAPVLKTQASAGRGVEEVLEAAEAHRAKTAASPARALRRAAQRRRELVEACLDGVEALLKAGAAPGGPFAEAFGRVEAGQESPHEAAARILASLRGGG